MNTVQWTCLVLIGLSVVLVLFMLRREHTQEHPSDYLITEDDWEPDHTANYTLALVVIVAQITLGCLVVNGL